MNKYLIRFNTKNNGDSTKVWRVFENGVEHLVADLKISSPVWSETSFEHDVQKWNIATEGHLKIINNVAYIDSFDLENYKPQSIQSINMDEFKQYMNAEELIAAGYITHPSSALHVMVEKPSKKIYESPDKGQTVYEREFGADPSTREVVKTSVQKQWTITFNDKKVEP